MQCLQKYPESPVQIESSTIRNDLARAARGEIWNYMQVLLSGYSCHTIVHWHAAADFEPHTWLHRGRLHMCKPINNNNTLNDRTTLGARLLVGLPLFLSYLVMACVCEYDNHNAWA